jgi:DNA (cytosine-5)-methyltransferase 1
VRYLSVCSGIEAATVAWHELGWEPVAYSEIESFPSSLLSFHYPHVPNWGDMTKFQEWPDADVDVLVGGTPCQSFSVAGLRRGLADPRGNLMLTFLAIALKYRPQWILWENVPGVLSSNGGRDFGTFLGGLGECGYGFAYRVLDAQYFGVAQRRRRVFVVGSARGWAAAAAVLFERESLRGGPAPSRGAGERPTGSLASRSTAGGGLGTDFELGGGLTHSLRGEGFDASEDGTGRGIPLIAGCLNSAGGHAVPGNSLQDADQGYLLPIVMSSGQANAEIAIGGGCTSLTCLHEAPIVVHEAD